MPVIFDIETIPNSNAPDFINLEEIKAPSNYKDQDKINAYIENERIKMVEKAALYWWSGRIIHISAYDETMWTFSGEIEKTLLIDFFTFLETKHKRSHVIGKSSKSFDIPFVVGRALVHNIGLPECIRSYYPNIIYDIDTIFGFSHASPQQASLNTYALGIGIEPKKANARMVKEWYNEKNWFSIKEYCDHDVEITAEIYKRFDKKFILCDKQDDFNF